MSSGLRQGAFSHDYVLEVQTGFSSVTDEQWVVAQTDRQRLVDDTRRFAEILEQQGVAARLPFDLVAYGLVTRQAEVVDGWRNTNVLPVVASRNRGELLRTVRYFIDNHPQGGWLRYGVVTFGERVPVFGELRDQVARGQRRISKFAFWAKREFGVHVVYRHGELTIDEDLSFHPHANILYYLERPLSKLRWAEFLAQARWKFGAHWKDCGRIQDAAEIVKYFVKGDDLALLADLANAVPSWADADFQQLPVVEQIARRMAAKSNRERSDRLPAEAFTGKAIAHVRQLVGDLRRHGASGAPHPFVWLFNEMFGLRISTALGDLKAFRRALRQERHSVKSVRGCLCKVEKQRREGGKGGGDILLPENQVLAVTLPQARFTRFAEPVALIRFFRPEPRTALGQRSLERLETTGEKSREWWDKNGAPDPGEALRSRRKAEDAAAGDGARDERRPPAALYGPHYYDNCPGLEAPYVTSRGDLIDRETGEVILECRPSDFEELPDFMDPRTWGVEDDRPKSKLIDKWKASSRRRLGLFKKTRWTKADLAYLAQRNQTA